MSIALANRADVKRMGVSVTKPYGWSPPGARTMTGMGDLATDAVCGATHFSDEMTGFAYGIVIGGVAGFLGAFFVRSRL